ncbi:MAG: hypothetical protein JJU24_03270, partial [Natronohydrobacter sp.]|nr:hypothetical protein [Natronohydrobacter sp.]
DKTANGRQKQLDQDGYSKADLLTGRMLRSRAAESSPSGMILYRRMICFRRDCRQKPLARSQSAQNKADARLCLPSIYLS